MATEKLKLGKPVEPIYINQIFGVDKKTYSRFGINGHNGLDFRSQYGQPIYASHDGYAYYEVDGDSGHGVVIVTDKPYDYNGKATYFKTIYWHMCDPAKVAKLASPIFKKVGVNTGKAVKVKKGDIIGYVNNTGFSSGDHLHYGLKPGYFTKEHKPDEAPNMSKWRNLEQDNGFKGSIDPTPFIEGVKKKPVYDGTIVSLQMCLRYEGFFPDDVEFYENYGPVTKQAVIKFQKDRGIWPALGVFGPTTKAVIKILYS